MKKINVPQGSIAWLEARMGIPTASEFDALISPLGKIRTGDGVDTYLCRKLSEKWRGEPLPSFSGGAMEQGSLKEDEAIPFLEFTTRIQLERVGFVTTDDGRYGCSPDAMIAGSNEGLECKCPMPWTHVSYLLDGILPKEYTAQSQGSMLVTGAQQWRFLSYARGMPPLMLIVERDDKFLMALSEALATFNERLDAGWTRLVELNGGEPQRKTVRERLRDTVESWDIEAAQIL